MDARKTKMDSEAAWQLLHEAETITTAKGKKILNFNPAENESQEILKHAMGPSGNLRAPTLRIGKRFLIGFNIDAFEAFFK